MKKINLLYLGALMVASSLTGCEDFLTKDPQNVQTNDTYWQTETSLRTYAQDFYSYYFSGYAADYTAFGGYFSGDNYTDDFLTLAGGYFYFPTAYNTNINNSTGTWSNGYDVVYKANVMLEKIPTMNISEEAKNHWMGIARYFRAMAYSTMAKAYAGVPYLDKVTDPSDVETLYKDRDSYVFVAQKILEDFKYALENVRENDTKRQVNKYVVGAYMSRELLYHATWLKYHKGGVLMEKLGENVTDADIKALLQGAIDGANVLMSSGKYDIKDTYNELFATDDLWENPEVVWYREYTEGLQCNALMSYNGPEDQTQGGITQNAIESYLCSDGLPIGQSSLYQGAEDPSIEKSFVDRDPRLYQTLTDSLRIMSATGTNYSAGSSPTGYATKKFLNEEWWAAGSEYCTGIKSPADAPCIRYAEVLLNYAEARYEISKVGGEAFKQADLDQTINELRGRQLKKYILVEVVDEATGKVTKELGQTDPQTMPTVSLSGSNLAVNGVTINDPARDADVDPILWEIRRERRVELMMEGRRGEDLRRWAKYENLNSQDSNGNPSKTILGAYVNMADYPTISAFNSDGERVLFLFDPENPTSEDVDKGYIYYLRNTTTPLRKFTAGSLDSERYYLRAIPASQETSYSDKGYKLTQNPGWEH
ncbi:MAG: RagB/SusD family nutrient uptake outer membrane protein [Bacteroides sp.]|nr:RagB/SusD family nutrient uptake outer membrane protein [Bacteroides sp.]